MIFTRKKIEPPIELALRKIEQAGASLDVKYRSYDDMWEATVCATRRDDAWVFLSSKQSSMNDAICGAALKLMREKL